MDRPKSARILIVDDEPAIAEVLRRWLAEEGYRCDCLNDSSKVLSRLASEKYHLVISDIHMPKVGGMELAQGIAREHPTVAVMLATGYGDRGLALRSVEIGVYGYLAKPFDRCVVLAAVSNALRRRWTRIRARRRQQRLEQEIQRRVETVHEREIEIAWRLVAAAECRDNETGAHIQRIGGFSAVLAEAMGDSPAEVEEIRLAAMMHDIGKIGVPDAILRKPGPLSREEYDVMKTHTLIGGQILAGSKIPLLRTARDIAMFHHERWNGSGYPSGLSGQAIPFRARLVAVADVYDALVQKRAYKEALPEDVALEIMDRERGKHFDPEILNIFFDHLPKIRAVREAAHDSDDSTVMSPCDVGLWLPTDVSAAP